MNKYMKGEILGKGTFGITYLCTEIATGHQYACKSIYKYKDFTETKREEILHEIEMLRWINLLEHPNIVSFKDSFEDEFSMNIITELCEGGELFDRFDKNVAFGELEVARMIKEIVGALEACHNFGILHRDLKLENLLFKTKDKYSTLKLIDFGFAEFCASDEELTDEVGTPTYVAPEVFEGHYGPKADIWSMGVILYTLLTRTFPFDANTLEDTYKEIIEKKDQLFAKKRWKGITKDAKDLTQKMLTYDVNQRLSACEVLKHPWITKMSTRLEERSKQMTPMDGVSFCKCM